MATQIQMLDGDHWITKATFADKPRSAVLDQVRASRHKVRVIDTATREVLARSPKAIDPVMDGTNPAIFDRLALQLQIP